MILLFLRMVRTCLPGFFLSFFFPFFFFLNRAQLMETAFLNLVNYASLMTTNAARYRSLAGYDVTLIEFGLRRAQVLHCFRASTGPPLLRMRLHSPPCAVLPGNPSAACVNPVVVQLVRIRFALRLTLARCAADAGAAVSQQAYSCCLSSP